MPGQPCRPHNDDDNNLLLALCDGQQAWWWDDDQLHILTRFIMAPLHHHDCKIIITITSWAAIYTVGKINMCQLFIFADSYLSSVIYNCPTSCWSFTLQASDYHTMYITIRMLDLVIVDFKTSLDWLTVEIFLKWQSRITLDYPGLSWTFSTFIITFITTFHQLNHQIHHQRPAFRFWGKH